MKKRLCSIVLSVAMLLSLLPTMALADVSGAPADGQTGLTVQALDALPEAGQPTQITLSGGQANTTATVRISGYNAPWYVTDGLVLMYDGIYNTGVVGTHDGSATAWTPLVSIFGDMKLTIPSSLQSGEGWTENGLYLKDSVSGTARFSSALTADDGFTWDYAFKLDQDYSTNWTKDGPSSPAYKQPVKLEITDSPLVGCFGHNYNTDKSGTKYTRILFFPNPNGVDAHAYNMNATEFAEISLSVGNLNESTRKVYADGSLVAAASNNNSHNYQVSGISLPLMNIPANTTSDGTSFNLGRTVYGTRLYNRELTADEIAQNAAVDALRYQTANYSIGSANGTQLLEQFDKSGKAYTEIQVAFDETGSATIPLTLNQAGANDLTFAVDGQSASLTLNVLSAADKAAVNEANTAIDAIPSEITEANLDVALAAVAAAQNKYNALSDELKALISDENQAKLENASTAIDNAAAGKRSVLITYQAAPGTVTSDRGLVTYKATNADGSHQTFTLAVPTRKNYTFVGWKLNGKLITGGNGVSYDWWDTLSDSTVVAEWKHNAEANAALEISESDDIYALARILGGTGTDADYQRFGYENVSADAKNSLQTASYKLTADIKLTNSNSFFGIPNFKGTFDGQGNTITLTIDFSQYTGQSASYGGVFQKLDGATVKNIKLAGSANGTLNLGATLNNVGLLAGIVEGSATTIENIQTNVAVDLTLNNNGHTAYFGEIVGRNALSSATKFEVKDCVNNGNIIATVDGELSNPSRVAGLIGHSNAGTEMTNCRNNGTVTVTGATTTVGGLTGSFGGTYTNCVEAGSLSTVKGSVNLFANMVKEQGKDAGNKIIVTVSGTDGEVLTAADGVTATVANSSATLELPVYYLDESTRRYEGFNTNEAIQVNGKSLYLFDMSNKKATLALSTASASDEALPFSSWETAIHLSSADDLINLQNAINSGDTEAIAALYGKNGVTAPDAETAQIVLRSAYYILDNDVELTSTSGFTGIGAGANFFGGHFDGGNHKVTLSISAAPSGTASGYYGFFGRMLPLSDSVVEVKNLNVEATIDLTLPASLSYSVYAGSLAGYAQHLTVENVSVTAKKISAATSGTMTGKEVVSLGGAFGFERVLYGGTVDTTVSGPISASWNGTTNSAQLGGFAGQGETGGSVTFTDGASITAATNTAHVGGIMGYSWAKNDFTGMTVKNTSNTPLQLGGTKADTGILIGFHTTAGIQPDEVGVKVDGFCAEGKYELSGAVVGGLIGVATTNGIVEIKDSAVNATIGGSIHGGLVGNAAYGDHTKFDISNTVYVKNAANLAAIGQQYDENKKIEYNTTPTGVIALDTDKLTNATFDTPVENVLSAAAPDALTVSGSATLSGANLTFTAAGEQEITFLWNGKELYTATVTVDAKDLTGENVSVVGVSSSYASNNAAQADADKNLRLVYNGKELVKGTDYTVTAGSDKFTITFTGNYAGTKEQTYSINTTFTATADNVTAVYDGQPHGITVNADGAAVTYSETADGTYDATAITRTNVGETTVYWKATKDGMTISGSAVITVTKADQSISYAAASVTKYVGEAPFVNDLTETSVFGAITYTSSDNSVATVDATGKVTIVGAGTATITAAAAGSENYNEASASYTLTVRYPYSPVTPGSSVTVPATANGSVTVSPSTASKGTTVTVTTKPNEGYELGSLEVLDKNGNSLALKDLGNGKYSFTMPDGKVTVNASFVKASVSTGFADVPANAYYADAVKWAVDKGVTNGLSDTLFGPYEPCTRAQIVTFLWRAAGSPEPKATTSKMTDLDPNAYYYKAVLWAVENGITAGMTDTTFAPNATCTRGQSVTFLYRALGKKVSSSASFSDVAANAFYADAVNWAVENNVTNGTSATTFSPNADCTRAEIVTFLYRAYQGK